VELFGAPAPAVAPIAANIPPAAAVAPAKNIPTPKPAPAKSAPVVTTVNNPGTVAGPDAVAVEGAQTESASAPATPPSVTQNVAPAPAVPATPAPQLNAVQSAFASPAHTLNDLYYILLLFFALVLGVNIFVKIRVQHPDLILGGLAVIVLVGLFIVVNQNTLLQVAIK